MRGGCIQRVTPPAPPSQHRVQPASIDPRYPLRIGEEYYPDASRRAGEEGRCLVRVSVAASGRIESSVIVQSSGSARLDAACLDAVKGRRMRPATDECAHREHDADPHQVAPVPKSLSTRIRVDAAVRARFPAFEGRLVYALDIENGPSDAHSRALLGAAAEHALASAGSAPAAHPRIAAWRDAYRAFGAKASAYPCSVEALLQRARKGGAAALPAINRLVDAYNAVSLQHLLPVGGEDLDRLEGDLVLRFATGDESFDGPEAGAAESGAAVNPGEVVWADDAGVTCRRWNWRQGRRTRLTEASRNAYFIIEGMGAAGDVLDAAAAALAEHARALANARSVYVLPL